MIKANEIRIGNWINYYETDTYFKVTEITKTMLEVENSEESTWIELDQFEGIPLTPDILENAGFDNNMSFPEWYGKCPIDVRMLSNVSEVFVGNTKTPVLCIHQLQNLHFALTGEELQINL